MGQYCILIHYHELGLKKNNKTWFEKIFQKNIQNHLKLLPFKNINTYASRVFVFGIDSNRWDEYQKILKNIMGLKNATLMYKVDADLMQIQDASKMMIEEKEFNSFRISARRQDKSFKHTSKELNQLVGEAIQKVCKKTVSLNEPDLNIIIEIVNNNLNLDIIIIQKSEINGYNCKIKTL